MNHKSKSILLDIINDNIIFLIPYLVFLIVGSIFVISYGHKQSFLILNSLHSPFFDTFFYYFTNAGNGIFTLIIVAILVLIKLKWAIWLFFSYISSGIFTQIIKNLLQLPRPKALLGENEILHYVDGVDIYMMNSFPSGHSASAFALFFLLSIIIKNQFIKFLFFIFAILVSYSRIYLVLHFPVDILVGSFLGITFTIAIYVIIDNNFNNQWLNSSLINLFINAKRKN